MAKAERGFVATSSVEGAWVGTWRPHRPHGPIMAQFTSPGPKYSIPGTTGYLADNPTKAKAPAYTFQRAKPPAAESCSPGPRYYVQPRVTSNGKDVAPAQHMGGLPKLKTAVTPGPSDYSIDKASKHVYRSPPAQSLAFRHTALRADQAPGEGTRGSRHAGSPPARPPSGSRCWAALAAGPRKSPRGRMQPPLDTQAQRLCQRPLQGEPRFSAAAKPVGASRNLPPPPLGNRPLHRATRGALIPAAPSLSHHCSAQPVQPAQPRRRPPRAGTCLWHPAASCLSPRRRVPLPSPGWSWTSTRNGLPRTPWEPKPDLEVTKRQSRGRQTTAWER